MAKSNVRKATKDIASALQDVFKRYTRNSREKAWENITSKDGHSAVDGLIRNPHRPLNNFGKLNFKEWINRT